MCNRLSLDNLIVEKMSAWPASSNSADNQPIRRLTRRRRHPMSVTSILNIDSDSDDIDEVT